MPEKDNSSKKQPELKIIDDSEEIHQLEHTPQQGAPSRKKSYLRRSQEKVALERNLEVPKAGPATPLSSVEPGNEPSAESAPLRIPPIFFVLAVAAFLLLLGIGIFLAMGGRNRNQLEAAAERAREKIQLAEQERKSARELVSKLSEALDGYASATTIEEKLIFARHPERVRPLMQSYYQTHELTPLSGAQLVNQFTLPIESRSFVILSAAFDDAPNKIFLTEINNDLSIKIDWESDVCFQPVDISQFIAEKPNQSTTLRVFANPDNFYVYDFGDSDKYQCLKLTFRDNEEVLYAYTERDSPTELKLREHFKRANQIGKRQPQPLLLKVRFLENSKAEQGVFIEEFISPRWAHINKSEP